VVSKKEVGKRLRELRLQRGLTQQELAQKLATTQSNVSGLERGTRSLTVHQVVKLAEALRTTTDDLLRGIHAGKHRDNGASRDRRFLRRLEQIDALPKRKKQALLTTIDAYLTGE
jgi:transcriptional regulator with XRE-family HTH domain